MAQPPPAKPALGARRAPSVNAIVDAFEAKSRSVSTSDLASASRIPRMPRSATNPRLPSASSSPRASFSRDSPGGTANSSPTSSRRPSLSSEAGPSRVGSPRITPKPSRTGTSSIPRPRAPVPPLASQGGLRKTSVDRTENPAKSPPIRSAFVTNADGADATSRRGSEPASPIRRRGGRSTLPHSSLPVRRPGVHAAADPSKTQTNTLPHPRVLSTSAIPSRVSPSPRPATSPITPTSPAHHPPILSVSHPTPERTDTQTQEDAGPSIASSAGVSTGPGSRRTSYRLSASIQVPATSSSSKSRESVADMSQTVDLTDDFAEPPPRKPSVQIPGRRSSAQSSATGSPRSRNHTPPPISPRSSSIDKLLDPFTVSPNSPSHASSNVFLGETVVSEKAERRSPSLKIDPPSINAEMGRPSPPVPAKNPLRSMSGRTSVNGHPRSPSLSRRNTTEPFDSPTATRGGTPELTPQNRDFEPRMDDQRLTHASATSQESAPQSTTSPDGEQSEKRVRRQSRMDDLWGRSNRAKTEHDLRLALPDAPKFVDSPIFASTPYAGSDMSHDADAGHTAVHNSPIRPVRSPSAPVLNGLGSAPQDIRNLAAKSVPPPLLPSPMARSPTAPVLSPRTPTSASSRRTHLIREIATTERAYAMDLGLIRDAYLSRYKNELGSRRPSASKSESDFMTITPLHSRTPSIDASQWAYATPSTVSSFKSPPSSAKSSMGPPVGKPLSPSDVRAVFLNISDLAAGAEDLAAAFEQAMGEEESGSGSISREGDVGTDRLGAVFTRIIPHLRPLYLYYCSRQQSASNRLLELLSDPSTAAHLNDCWRQIKSRTHAWNLDSMLIKPVQRITKYPLLFEDLMSCTTPVHPDYFNIRSAAELARTIAVEIDEAKRRKDVVANAISTRKTPKPTQPSPAKEPRKGLKMFRKEKPPALPVSVSTSSLTTDALPPEISKASLALLSDLVMRMDEADQVIRRVGREVIVWTANAKEILLAEDQLLATWMTVVHLDMESPGDRMIEMRRTLSGIMSDCWAILNAEVRDRIMPIFSKLLDSTVNPRKVIMKRESKSADYTRYFGLAKSKRNADRALLTSARDFYALHCQLVEELPIFLDGYTRILDLALVAFAEAQARYFAGMSSRVQAYARRWIARPRNAGRSTEDSDSGRGIVQAWHDAWQPYGDAMENFHFTSSSRAVATRMASFNTRSGSRPASRISTTDPAQSSPSTSRHSVTDTIARTPSRASTATSTRARSTSLLGKPPGPLPSPSKESRFNLLRVGSKTPKSAQNSPRTSRPTSLHITGTEINRHSFGLPKIPDGIDGLGKLGISPTSSLHRVSPGPVEERHGDRQPSAASVQSTASLSEASTDHDDTFKMERRRGVPRSSERRPSEFGVAKARASDANGLGLGEGAQRRVSKSSVHSRRPSDRSPTHEDPHDRRTDIPPPLPSPQRLDERRTKPFPPPTSLVRRPSDIALGRNGSTIADRENGYDGDAADGWRNEPVLYQCACVADFDPFVIGNKRYRGLRFLSMRPGDLFDIFHEVGRIDELPKFPYPEVGVDNDGVLVGRGENEAIGLLICSFLEPLRE